MTLQLIESKLKDKYRTTLNDKFLVLQPMDTNLFFIKDEIDELIKVANKNKLRYYMTTLNTNIEFVMFIGD